MNPPVKFDLGVKCPWNRSKSVAWVLIPINDRKTRWDLSVENASGAIRFSINVAFFKGLLHKIFVNVRMYDIKTKIVRSKKLATDNPLILDECYTFDDVLIYEAELGALGYGSPDDLSVTCAFEVISLNFGIVVPNIDDDVNHGDLDLACNDGVNIKVHQFVLFNQSAALKRSLKRNKNDVDNAKLLKMSFSSDVVKEMVRYLYTGKVAKVTGKEKELMQIASEFQLKGIFDECEKFCAESLNVDNVIDTMIFAEQQKSEILMVASVAFAKMHFKEIKTTEGWKQIHKHPLLVLRLLNSIDNVS